MIEIVYTGPAGSHRAFDESGEPYRLVRGVPTEVPDELAERLCEGEEFDFAEDVECEPETETPEPVDEEIEEPTAEEDPEGVNASSPYGEE